LLRCRSPVIAHLARVSLLQIRQLSGEDLPFGQLQGAELVKAFGTLSAQSLGSAVGKVGKLVSAKETQAPV
jgi:hypothetical protein